MFAHKKRKKQNKKEPKRTPDGEVSASFSIYYILITILIVFAGLCYGSSDFLNGRMMALNSGFQMGKAQITVTPSAMSNSYRISFEVK